MIKLLGRMAVIFENACSVEISRAAGNSIFLQETKTPIQWKDFYLCYIFVLRPAAISYDSERR